MPVYGLVSTTASIVVIVLAVLVLVVICLMMRNRERCPKDGGSMQLVPGPGHHMIFKCPKCGHRKKTHIRKGRR